LTAKIQAIRGMNDILPDQTPSWQFLESICRQVTAQYGYHEIRLPIVEKTALFYRTIGQATDIVEKEMYTFEDRGGESITLRPEGTASCVRAGLEHGLFQQPQRLWYTGPMFRYERPQKGRYRQFHHWGVEAFGIAGPEMDAEHLFMNFQIIKRLGLENHVELQINTLGTQLTRTVYRSKLVEYFKKNASALDEDSLRRLEVNPLRILDSKNPDMQLLIENAPKLLDFVSPEENQHFDKLLSLLKAANIPFRINPRLVRGLDYYDLTVYEWVTTELGAQGTVSAGGRYNRLVEELGGKPTPAVGFALGIERLILLLEKVRSFENELDVFCVCAGEEAMQRAMLIAEKIRTEIPHLKVEVNLTGGSFKSQFKRADKSGAQWALIWGEDELKSNTISIKNLKAEAPQIQVNAEQLITFFKTGAKK
jgi:histidyl-tRNA synthetase